MQQTTSVQERPGEPIVMRSAPLTQLPQNTHALIYRPARSAMTSGKRRTRAWKLRFERRTAPVIEPLMGWSGGDDTLTQVELSFPSAQAAIAYARKHGLQYTVLSPSRGDMMQGPSPARSAFTERRLRLEWVERTLGPDVIRNGFGPGLDPAVCYAEPQDVLRDPKLDPAQKREVLHRWALDAYLLELAYSKGEPQAQLSRLQEVIDALIDLGQPASTSPAL